MTDHEVTFNVLQSFSSSSSSYRDSKQLRIAWDETKKSLSHQVKCQVPSSFLWSKILLWFKWFMKGWRNKRRIILWTWSVLLSSSWSPCLSWLSELTIQMERMCSPLIVSLTSWTAAEQGWWLSSFDSGERIERRETTRIWVKKTKKILLILEWMGWIIISISMFWLNEWNWRENGPSI